MKLVEVLNEKWCYIYFFLIFRVYSRIRLLRLYKTIYYYLYKTIKVTWHNYVYFIVLYMEIRKFSWLVLYDTYNKKSYITINWYMSLFGRFLEKFILKSLRQIFLLNSILNYLDANDFNHGEVVLRAFARYLRIQLQIWTQQNFNIIRNLY